MTAVVISQPMLFPWVGLFEQIRLADIYVHLDDAQFSKGSFFNRVQVKGPAGPHWLTAPLQAWHLGDAIRDVRLDARVDWRTKHLAVLAQFYDRAPFRDEMLALVRAVYQAGYQRLDELAEASIEVSCRYFDLADPSAFRRASSLGVAGAGSGRVLAMVRALGGDAYVTGHGARRYLDHEAFERDGVAVSYVAYRRTPYAQLHGAFDPHVSILDLIANLGRAGRDVIASPPIPWRSFIHGGTPA